MISSVGSPVRRQTAVTIQPTSSADHDPAEPDDDERRRPVQREKEQKPTAATATR